MWRTIIAAAIGFVLGAFLFVGKVTYDGINIEEAARVFSDVGLPAIRKVSTEGMPYLGSNIGGTDFEVHFYVCSGEKKDRKCENMSIFAGWPASEAWLEPANYWNRKFMVTKMYLNDTKDTVYLRMDIPLKGGVTNDQLKFYLRLWQVLMPKFVRYIHGEKL
jgi:hypothetical protein